MTEGVAPAVRAADVQRVLALFAHGLAGRTLLVKPSAEAPPIGRTSVIGTDGATIVVPEAVDGLASARENFGAYLVTVLHQLAQIEEGTYAFAAQHDEADWHEGTLFRRLFVLLEDRRIDLALQRHYPGVVADLDRVLARACSELPPAEGIAPSDGGFSPALEKLVAAFSGRREGPASSGVGTVGASPPAGG